MSNEFYIDTKLYEVFLKPTNAASSVPVARKIALTVAPFRTSVTDFTGITYTLTTLSFGDECFRITYIANLNFCKHERFYKVLHKPTSAAPIFAVVVFTFTPSST